jgi:tRNA-dihydrouridine synthase 2
MDTSIDYRGKLILAPMVRTGTLAFRLLAKSYGADIVYSEELVDRKLVQTKRVENEERGTVEYILEKDNTIVWSTCDLDTVSVVQLGTASEEYAVKAAQHLYRDYDAVDVNMGCPERFSTQGGMGAALLVDRERVKQVLSGLVRNIDKPVTCKIRLLEKLEDTIDLVKSIEMMGVKAIAVHGRYIPQRPRQPAYMSLIKHLSDVVSIPMIANGDVYKYEDVETTKEVTGCDSVMIARGALVNCSIFSPDNPRPQKEVAMQYLNNCIHYGNPFAFTKYTVSRMFGENGSVTRDPWYQQIILAKSITQMKEILQDEIDTNGYGPIEWGRVGMGK